MSMMSIVFNVSVLFAVARFCGNNFVCRRFQQIMDDNGLPWPW